MIIDLDVDEMFDVAALLRRGSDALAEAGAQVVACCCCDMPNSIAGLVDAASSSARAELTWASEEARRWVLDLEARADYARMDNLAPAASSAWGTGAVVAGVATENTMEMVSLGGGSLLSEVTIVTPSGGFSSGGGTEMLAIGGGSFTNDLTIVTPTGGFSGGSGTEVYSVTGGPTFTHYDDYIGGYFTGGPMLDALANRVDGLSDGSIRPITATGAGAMVGGPNLVTASNQQNAWALGENQYYGSGGGIVDGFGYSGPIRTDQFGTPTMSPGPNYR